VAYVCSHILVLLIGLKLRVQRKFPVLHYSRLNFQSYAILDFFFDICHDKYQGILVRLSILSLPSKQQHLDVILIISIFRSNICSSSILDTVTVHLDASCAVSS
jgi:hypothetical protein